MTIMIPAGPGQVSLMGYKAKTGNSYIISLSVNGHPLNLKLNDEQAKSLIMDMVESL